MCKNHIHSVSLLYCPSIGLELKPVTSASVGGRAFGELLVLMSSVPSWREDYPQHLERLTQMERTVYHGLGAN